MEWVIALCFTCTSYVHGSVGSLLMHMDAIKNGFYCFFLCDSNNTEFCIWTWLKNMHFARQRLNAISSLLLQSKILANLFLPPTIKGGFPILDIYGISTGSAIIV